MSGKRDRLFARGLEFSKRPADAEKSSTEDCVRILEFETPAAILCGTDVPAIPKTFRTAYFDLVSTGFKPSNGGAFRLLLRLIGSAAHLRQFRSVDIMLRHFDTITATINVPLDNTAEHFTKAVELSMEAASGKISVKLLLSDGRSAECENKELFKIAAPTNKEPGFTVALAAKGGTGEFWADMSLLHSPETAFPKEFDFAWLFGGAEEIEPALAMAPQNLRSMTEAQARVVSVSPPIPVVLTN